MSLLSRWMERIGIFKEGETDELEAARAVAEEAPVAEPIEPIEDRDAGLFVDPAFTGENPFEAEVRVPFPGADDTEEVPAGGEAVPGVDEPAGDAVMRISLADLLEQHLSRDAADREVALVHQAGLDVDWDDIYEAGGLDPIEEGFTVEHVARIAEANPDADPVGLRIQLLEGMSRAGTTPKRVLGDALGRDETLDVYERILEESVKATNAGVDEDVRRLQGHIAQLEAQIVERRGQQRALEDRLDVWRDEKRALERRWQAALVHLVKQGEDVPTLE